MENLKEYWNNRYAGGGTSGNGSYGVEAVTKANIINHWIQELQIKTINEIGVGDGNNLLFYKIPIMYTGYDISEKAIQLCQDKTRRIANSLKYNFTTLWSEMDFEADLCLCLDVWFHQVDDKDFESLCETLFGIGMWKYIIIYSTDTDSQVTIDGSPMGKHMRPRQVLAEVQKWTDWEVKAVIGGIKTSDDKVFEFPDGKKFFLLERNFTKLA